MLTIKIELDPDSVDKALAEIKTYKASLYDKLKTLIARLVQEGVDVAKVQVAASQGDSTDAYVDYLFNPTGDIIKATIWVQGQDAVFIEFGAGIAYNTGVQHPYASEFGFGPGTYPSKHPPNKAINPGRWVYGHNDDGTPLWSIGTEATMPMFYAANAIRNNLIQAAVEEFMRG